MNIKLIIKILCGASLVATSTLGHTDTAGLNFNEDGVEAHYQKQLIEYKEYRILPSYSFLYSQETWPHNFLLRADGEIISYTQTFGDGYTAAPKVVALIAQYQNNDIIAPAIGGAAHFPKGGKIPFDIDADAFWAPPPFALIDGQFMWGMSIQGHYPLPQDNELRFGYRKINASADQGPHGSLDQGIFVGFASFF
ncbi:MAG: hypothetical protein HY272_06115 [Gammaproteobacteria bacterium]|nr:hypothetical protein [Gammaproteobacteria bacterium]